MPPYLCFSRYLSIPVETLRLVCAFSSLCAQSCLCVLKKKFSVVHVQPGGIRRTFDTPPPRQLTPPLWVSPGAFKMYNSHAAHLSLKEIISALKKTKQINTTMIKGPRQPK